MPDIDIGWKVRLEELQAELRKGGDLSSAEVRRLGADLRTALKRTETEAEKSARKIAKEQEKLAREVARGQKQAQDEAAKAAAKAAAEHEKAVAELRQGTQKVLSMIGGPFAELGDLGLGLGEKLSGASKVLGTTGTVAAGAALGVTALAVGTVAVYEGLHQIAEAGVKAEERLREIKGAAALPPNVIESLDQYRQSQLGLEVQTATLKAKLGALVSDVWSPGIDVLAELTQGVADAVPRWADWEDTVEQVGTGIRGMQLLLTLGASEIVRYGAGLNEVADAGRDAAAGLDDLTAAIGRHDRALEERAKVEAQLAEGSQSDLEILQDLGLVYDDAKDLAREAAEKAERERRAREAASKALQAQAEATRQAEEVRRQYLEINERDIAAEAEHKKKLEEEAWAMATLTGQTKLLVAGLQDLQDQIDTTMAAIDPTWVERWGISFSSALDDVRQKLDDLGLAEAGQALDYGLNAAADAFGQQAELLADQVRARRDAAREQADAWLEQQQAQIEAEKEAGQISDDEAEARLAALDAERAAKEDAISRIGQAEAAQAMKAFERTKKIQKALAVIDGLRAAVSLIPAFAFLGPGAPLAAAALATLAVKTQVAAIDAQDPPELATGRVPGGSGDHRTLVRLRDDETDGVLTGRGVAAVGGPDAVRRANAGLPGGPSQLVVQLDGREIADGVFGPGGVARMQRGRGVLGRRAIYGRG